MLAADLQTSFTAGRGFVAFRVEHTRRPARDPDRYQNLKQQKFNSQLKIQVFCIKIVFDIVGQTFDIGASSYIVGNFDIEGLRYLNVEPSMSKWSWNHCLRNPFSFPMSNVRSPLAMSCISQ